MGKKTAQRQPKEIPTPTAALSAILPKGSILPTPEWLARYEHDAHSPTNSSGQKIGRACFRRPWFESLYDRDQGSESLTFTVAGLKALRFYREAAEACEHSETKSCLASLMPRSGGGSGPSPAIANARSQVASIERLLGTYLPTMRAVTIFDMSYAQVAMARFGSRDIDHYDDVSGTITKRIAPRSGRHTAQVREEFHAGVKVLVAAVRGRTVERTVASPFAVVPVSSRPICDAIDAMAAHLLAIGKSPTAIVASTWAAESIARENGIAFDAADAAKEMAYRGLPVTVRPDWVSVAWMLLDGEKADMG